MNNTYSYTWTSTATRYVTSTTYPLVGEGDDRPICKTCGLRVNFGDEVEHADIHAEDALARVT